LKINHLNNWHVVCNLYHERADNTTNHATDINIMIIISLLYLRFRKNEKVVAIANLCIANIRKMVGMPYAA
jgi:hypothetical protein